MSCLGKPLGTPCKLKGWKAGLVPERAQSLLRSCIPESWSRDRAGRLGHSGIPLPWRGARSTSSFDFFFPSSSVPVKRVPWAQAVGTSGAGRRLDSSLPDLPGRMWLSLGEGRNPAPPLQTLLSPRVLPAGILRKGLQPGAPAGGRGGEEAPSERWAEASSQLPFPRVA